MFCPASTTRHSLHILHMWFLFPSCTESSTLLPGKQAQLHRPRPARARRPHWRIRNRHRTVTDAAPRAATGAALWHALTGPLPEASCMCLTLQWSPPPPPAVLSVGSTSRKPALTSSANHLQAEKALIAVFRPYCVLPLTGVTISILPLLPLRQEMRHGHSKGTSQHLELYSE